MTPATDSAKNRAAPRRPVWVLLALLGLSADLGCARLQAFRKDEKPTFGTDTVSGTGRRPGRFKNDDLYADRLSRPLAPVGRSPSRKSKAVGAEGSDAPAVAADDRRPIVSLLPPVTLAAGDARKDDDEQPQDAPAEDDKRDSLALVRPAVHGSAEAPAREAPPRQPSLAEILARSRKRVDSLKSYRVKMSHQERVSGTLNAAEDVVLNVRREPLAIRLEWHTGPHQGREVVYAADSATKNMFIHMPNSPIPRLSMAPDSPLATRNSRHPITEAGYDTIIGNMEAAAAKEVAGDLSLGKIRYEGRETPEGFDTPCDKIVRVTPTKEKWVVYLDSRDNLPVVVEAKAGNGELLEHYEFRDPLFNPADLASAESFDPDARWGKSAGLFQRLARGNAKGVEEKSAQ